MRITWKGTIEHEWRKFDLRMTHTDSFRGARYLLIIHESARCRLTEFSLHQSTKIADSFHSRAATLEHGTFCVLSDVARPVQELGETWTILPTKSITYSAKKPARIEFNCFSLNNAHLTLIGIAKLPPKIFTFLQYVYYNF